MVLAAVLLTACTATSGPSGGSNPPNPWSEQITRSEQLTTTTFADNQPGCSFAVAKSGAVVWSQSRGLADVAAQTPITAETTFEIGSTTKQFTALAALLLIQDGRLRADTPVGEHVTRLPIWMRAVTVDQLIHHTTGIAEYLERLDLLDDFAEALKRPLTQDAALAAIRTFTSPESTPGTQFLYSNSNYLLLAEVVEHVTGQPLAEVMRTQIFEPAGMAAALDAVRQPPGTARLYLTPDATEAATIIWSDYGAKGIQTTPIELVKWADHYRVPKVGDQALVDRQLADPVAILDPDQTRYAAGLFLDVRGGIHHGGTFGTVTTFDVSVDRTTALAFSCNRPDVEGAPIGDELRAIWGI